MKKIFNKIKDWFTWYWPYLLVIIALVFSLWLTYIIANSNMPDWLKWWLLR